MMAVSSLQYTMGISSGFKVYILEGQHSARNTDRYRPLTSHGIPIYPIKRKLSPDPPQPPKKLCASSHQSRQKSSHSHSKDEVCGKTASRGSCQTQGTCCSPGSEKCPEEVTARPEDLGEEGDRRRTTSSIGQKMRPSVITCISGRKASPPSDRTGPLQASQPPWSPKSCFPEVEEHFHRSLQSCCPWSAVRAAPSQSSGSSVEDHFSKALGSQWLLIRAVADSPSSQEPPHRR